MIAVLPKVMQWYRADFGRGPADCVRAACLYLPERQCRLLSAALDPLDGGVPPLTVTYGTYEFSCQFLWLQEQRVSGFFPLQEEWTPGGGASFD